MLGYSTLKQPSCFITQFNVDAMRWWQHIAEMYAWIWRPETAIIILSASSKFLMWWKEGKFEAVSIFFKDFDLVMQSKGGHIESFYWNILLMNQSWTFNFNPKKYYKETILKKGIQLVHIVSHTCVSKFPNFSIT